MKIKATIKKDSIAAQAVRKFMAEKEAFKKAVQNGEAVKYAKTKPVKFATPV